MLNRLRLLNVVSFSKTPKTPKKPKRPSLEALKNYARTTIAHCHGDTEAEQKKWCVKVIHDMFESVDGMLPIIGTLVDIPLVDVVEEDAIRLLVDWAWVHLR